MPGYVGRVPLLNLILSGNKNSLLLGERRRRKVREFRRTLFSGVAELLL